MRMFYIGISKYIDSATSKTRGLCIDHFEQGCGVALVELFSAFKIDVTLKMPQDMLQLDEEFLDYDYLVPELANRYKYYLRKRNTIEVQANYEYIPEMFLEDNLDDLEKLIEDILKKSLVKDKFAEISTFNRKEKNLEILEKSKEKAAQTSPFETVQIFGDTMIIPLNEEESNRKKEMPSLANLSLLLNQGVFPEMDKDGDKIKKINQMFDLVEPSVKIHVFDGLENDVGKELLAYPEKMFWILEEIKK